MSKINLIFLLITILVLKKPKHTNVKTGVIDTNLMKINHTKKRYCKKNSLPHMQFFKNFL